MAYYDISNRTQQECMHGENNDEDDEHVLIPLLKTDHLKVPFRASPIIDTAHTSHETM